MIEAASPKDLLAHKARDARLLGLDVGSKTIGLALSDRGWRIATPLETLKRTKFRKDLRALKALVTEHQIVGLVIGWPLNMNGSEGPRCQSTRSFAENIQEDLPLPICFWDERLSTVASERALLEADMSRKRREEVIDKMAASYILQGVLDSL